MGTEAAADPGGIQRHLDRVEALLHRLQAGDAARETVEIPLESGSPRPGDILAKLIAKFGLSLPEADLLRIAAAPEFEPDIADTFAQLQGDRRARRARFELALRLVEPDPARRTALLSLLHRDRPLMRFQLLEPPSEPARGSQLLSEQVMSLDPDITYQLSGLRLPAARWPHALSLVEPSATLESFALHPKTRKALDALLEMRLDVDTRGRHVNGPSLAENLLLYFHGEYGSGRRAAGEVLARHWGLELLLVDCRMVSEEVLGSPRFLRLVMRDAMRLGAMPMFLHVDKVAAIPSAKAAQGEDDMSPAVDLVRLEKFMNELACYAGPVVFSDTEPPVLDRILGVRDVVPVEFPARLESAEVRDEVWFSVASALPGDLDRKAVANVARQFAFSQGEIRDVARAAYSLAAARNPADPKVEPQDLYHGAVSQFRHNLDRYSTRPRTLFVWDDLVLPADVKQQLKRLESYIRHRERVFDDWGLGRKVGLTGRGVKALFVGKSGTGKTMAAQIIASTLGVELYKVDLAMIFNKFVGETEKSIKRVFSEAKKSHGLILFDEADALFGKRKGDSGANRWMGMLVNYLLQEFEEYDGGAILTTNMPDAMDTAFNRRLHFVIEFPEPDETMRLELWRSMIPPELPLAGDINLKRLARQFELTGGNIRNVVMDAAFMCAETERPVTMLDLMRAVQDEFRKVGKTSSRSDFKEYFDQLL